MHTVTSKLIALLLLLPMATLHAASDAPAEVVVYKDSVKPKLRLHIYNPPGHSAKDNRPAIVFFFGGGWKGGSHKQFEKQSRYLASRGMVAICADYRTAQSHKTTPAECVKDGKSAVRWIRSHAGELGIDPDRLAAGGGSAGGHVAAATATTKGFDEDGEDATVSCMPNALVLFNPVYDNGPGGYGHSRVTEYWKEFSPMHNIHKDMPPTIVYLGDSDNLIPVSTGETFQKKMKDLGLRSELHIYKNMPHGFFNKARFYETLLETDRFLTSLGYLEGKPTLEPKPAAR